MYRSKVMVWPCGIMSAAISGFRREIKCADLTSSASYKAVAMTFPYDDVALNFSIRVNSG